MDSTELPDLILEYLFEYYAEGFMYPIVICRYSLPCIMKWYSEYSRMDSSFSYQEKANPAERLEEDLRSAPLSVVIL